MLRRPRTRKNRFYVPGMSKVMGEERVVARVLRSLVSNGETLDMSRKQ